MAEAGHSSWTVEQPSICERSRTGFQILPLAFARSLRKDEKRELRAIPHCTLHDASDSQICGTGRVVLSNSVVLLKYFSV